MGFKIPSPRYPGTKATATDFRIAFGKKSKLPNNKHRLWGLCGDFALILEPPMPNPRADNRTGMRHNAKHRVFANCPTCDAEVPAGRTMQHKCKSVQPEPVLLRFEVRWAPEGKLIAATWARNAAEAKRIVLKNNPEYKKYPGEVYAELTGQD